MFTLEIELSIHKIRNYYFNQNGTDDLHWLEVLPGHATKGSSSVLVTQVVTRNDKMSGIYEKI